MSERMGGVYVPKPDAFTPEEEIALTVYMNAFYAYRPRAPTIREKLRGLLWSLPGFRIYLVRPLLGRHPDLFHVRPRGRVVLGIGRLRLRVWGFRLPYYRSF
jgi:hypothetical protein